jgi:hypothetical protein
MSMCGVCMQVDIPAALPGITAVRMPPVVVGTSQPTIPVPAPAVPSLLPGPAPAVPVTPGSPTHSSAPDAAISPPDCPDKQPTGEAPLTGSQPAGGCSSRNVLGWQRGLCRLLLVYLYAEHCQYLHPALPCPALLLGPQTAPPVPRRRSGASAAPAG